MRLNEMLKVNMYLDDLRNPPPIKKWLILRSSKEAIDYVKKHGMPEYCSFDHDLGGDDTTMVFLKWLVDYDMDNGGKVIPESFHYDIHSANPVGVKNISGLLDNYLDFRKNQ
jgi:hypothetical protein